MKPANGFQTVYSGSWSNAKRKRSNPDIAISAMVKRDFYAILGVPARAETAEIKRAYRQLAFSLHPDVGAHPDPERFHEVHEAYEVLSNPDQRKAYDLKLVGRGPSSSAEPLRAHRRTSIVQDHSTRRPTIEELLDRISQNFVGYRRKTEGPYRRLGMEAVLEPEEARFGCRLPLWVPGYAECPECRGSGEAWGWHRCSSCYGRGIVATVCSAIIEIPSGACDGDRYEIDLSSSGISPLLFEVRIVVP
jgi:molecular chaperone DnaJ